jgi:hypothetical protein
MKKTLVAALTVATVAGSLMTATAPVQAHDGVGVGLAAGLLGGAIVGGAIAASRPAPVYVAEPPPPGPCYWQRQRYWDGYGWVIRPVRVCY